MAVRHEYKAYHQPTNHSCSQTALAMVLSHYESQLTPEQVAEAVPTSYDEAGAEIGTVPHQLALWCLNQGFRVELWSFDQVILDLDWAKLSSDRLLERLEAAMAVRTASMYDAGITRAYLEAYVGFAKAGGLFTVAPYLRRALLDDWVEQGPVFLNVSSQVYEAHGRTTNQSLRHSVPDDVHGELTTHSLALVGRETNGHFIVADPWNEVTEQAIDPEQLVAAIMAAQVWCDNQIFKLTRA